MKLSEFLFEIFFFLVNLGLILGSLGVVLLTDMIYSAFLLGFVFACISLLYLLLDSDFIAAAQILIYVGAINISILFAVMLIKKKKQKNFFLFWTIGDVITSVICSSLFLLLSDTISKTSWSEIYLFTQLKNGEIFPRDNIRRIGSELLTDFIIPFELMSIILLVALIGAIVLAREEKINDLEK